MGKMSVYRA